MKPINKDAAMIIRPAKRDDIWMPEVNVDSNKKFDKNILGIKKIPDATYKSKHFIDPTGKRRGRFVVFGYAEEQSENKNKPAKWVVRCDCGNFEHRTRIIRWLETEDDDMCIECMFRSHKTEIRKPDKKKAVRNTVSRVNTY